MADAFGGKAAQVTGGASGIGAAIVRELAGSGARVVIADTDLDMAQALASELGTATAAFKVDVSIAAEVEAMVAFAQRTFGSLHLAVNNARISGADAATGELAPEIWKRHRGGHGQRVLWHALSGTGAVGVRRRRHRQHKLDLRHAGRAGLHYLCGGQARGHRDDRRARWRAPMREKRHSGRPTTRRGDSPDERISGGVLVCYHCKGLAAPCISRWRIRPHNFPRLNGAFSRDP